MASIRKRVRPDGRIRYDVTVTKRGAPRLYQSFDVKSHAQAWARKTEHDIERGAWRSTEMAEQSTLADLLGRYGREEAPKKRSAKGMQQRIERLCRHDITKLPMISLTAERLAMFRDSRMKSQAQLGGPLGKTTRPISSQTVRHEMILIGTVIKHGMREWGLVLPAGNPMLTVRLPAQGKPRERRTNGNEYERLLDAARSSKSPRLPHAIELAVETSMRRGELCNLRWSDVDLEKRVAHCRITKNGESRNVALSRRAVEVFQSLPRRDGDDEQLVLGFKTAGLTRAFVRLRDRLGMKDLKLHDLRHEATSRLAAKLNGDLIALASMTGHKTLSMLQRYTHLRAEDVAKRLD